MIRFNLANLRSKYVELKASIKFTAVIIWYRLREIGGDTFFGFHIYIGCGGYIEQNIFVCLLSNITQPEKGIRKYHEIFGRFH